MVGWHTRTVEIPDLQVGSVASEGGFVPDLPVYKKSKQDLRDVFINDGLHMHGIGVANRLGRISESLDVHFGRNWINISRATSAILTLSGLPVWRNT